MTDYDNKIDFSTFKTYNYFKNVGNDLSDLDIKRVIYSINKQLKVKGFAKSEKPDFYINVVSNVIEVENNNSIGIGVGNGGFGISGGLPIGSKKLLEEFKIEYVSSKTDEVIWEAFLKSKIKESRSPNDKELHYKEIIKQILNTYPPKK
ncbi:DUF4136 domain-containing protein [Polaribacter ponticola]|uniref:DUF4136 domain-containing protein n=1 Tax=Polaribacter ponticola TaxID=2978475 RepID=A0ABT5S9H4_9FLAO|nr:DUF4136 domain-containing protein [Polaribacter sp. MSW5]MDD7914772.1 DUF4136 domain-containing protein [Polaribacter sp. MSW5]